MISIDTGGLRSWADGLRPITEALVPIPVPAAEGAGFPELAVALTRLEDQREATQLVIAREVDALIAATFSAAARWEHAEQVLAGSAR